MLPVFAWNMDCRSMSLPHKLQSQVWGSTQSSCFLHSHWKIHKALTHFLSWLVEGVTVSFLKAMVLWNMVLFVSKMREIGNLYSSLFLYWKVFYSVTFSSTESFLPPEQKIPNPSKFIVIFFFAYTGHLWTFWSYAKW
jgi:hypothetical protein